MRLAVANDTHFTHAGDITKAVRKFVRRLDELDADTLLFTGDISDNRDWPDRLSHIRQDWKQDILYVLGNHDYYGWSWQEACDAARALDAKDDQLTWLDMAGHLMLDEDVAIVGSSSPSCLTVGDSPLKTRMWDCFNDFIHIEELSSRIGNPSEMCAVQTDFAMRAGTQLHFDIGAALDNKEVKRIIVATHVAPYWWSAKWRGQPTQPDIVPFYVNKYLGDTVDFFADMRPDVEFVCLHGHTHGAFRGKHETHDNVMIMAGAAEYGHPKVQMVLDTSLPFCGAQTA